MPGGQGPAGRVAAHNGFLKGQGMTLLTEELPKVERPWLGVLAFAFSRKTS